MDAALPRTDLGAQCSEDPFCGIREWPEWLGVLKQLRCGRAGLQHRCARVGPHKMTPINQSLINAE